MVLSSNTNDEPEFRRVICETKSGDKYGGESAVDTFDDDDDDDDREVSSEGRTMRSSAVVVVVVVLAVLNGGMSGVRIYVVRFQRERIGILSLVATWDSE